MRKTFLYITLAWLILLLLSSLLLASNSFTTSLTLQTCNRDSVCSEAVGKGFITSLYSPSFHERKRAFNHEAMFAAWQILHPEICANLLILNESGDSMWTWQEMPDVITEWRTAGSAQDNALVFLESYFYIPTTTTLHRIQESLQTDLRTCYLWMLVVTPERLPGRIFRGFSIGDFLHIYPAVIDVNIESIAWACEIWVRDINLISPDVREKQDRDISYMRSLLKQNPTHVTPQELSSCDWYLWCDDVAQCMAGGKRFYLHLPSPEE